MRKFIQLYLNVISTPAKFSLLRLVGFEFHFFSLFQNVLEQFYNNVVNVKLYLNNFFTDAAVSGSNNL